MATVVVLTEYYLIPNSEVKEMAEHIFDPTQKTFGFDKEQIEDMKKDFLNGETVGAETKYDDGRVTRSRWRVDYKDEQP